MWSYFTSAQDKYAKLGLALSVVALLVGLMVWHDNIAGFRDAAAFATLIGAIFSGLSVVWVALAVLMQADELRLQRGELALQREQLAHQVAEMHQLASASKEQSRISEEQTKYTLRRDILYELSAFCLQYDAEMQALLATIMRTRSQIVMAKQIEISVTTPLSVGLIENDPDGMRVTWILDSGDEFARHSFRRKELRAALIDRIHADNMGSNLNVLGFVAETFERSREFGLENWMIFSALYSVPEASRFIKENFFFLIWAGQILAADRSTSPLGKWNYQ